MSRGHGRASLESSTDLRIGFDMNRVRWQRLDSNPQRTDYDAAHGWHGLLEYPVPATTITDNFPHWMDHDLVISRSK
jgi:hypothetical protein